MLTILTGVVAGIFHVLSGPDHLAAIAPLAIEGKQRGWAAGWTWGIGHASGVVAVAVALVLLRDLLPPVESISAWSERAVGAALIAIGVWALRRSLRIEATAHVHGPVRHDHLHLRRGPAWLQRMGHVHASFCLGVLHGVAGSSHFFGVLPALALPTRAGALAYLAAFGVGTIAAMTMFAAAVGFAGLRRSSTAAHRAMMTAAALLAFAVGGWWLVVGG